MVSLDIRLSRRDLLKLGGITTANLVVPASEDRVKVVTPLIKQRQQSLDQIVALEHSPYVRKVIYDHDGSLKRSADYAHARRAFDDPQLLKYLIKYRDDRTSFKPTEEDVLSLPDLPKLVKDALAFSLFIVKGLQIDKSDDKFAAPSYYASDFGKGVKPDIYIFGDTFEKLFIETPQGDIEVPTEKRIRATLQHEYIHAEEIFKGVYLGKGLVINSTNYFDIHPSVRKFVGEVNAYLKEVEFARQFGREHPVYWFALGQLMGNITDDYNKHIRNRNFNPYETRLIELQISKVDALRPEAKRIFEKFK